MIYGHGDDVFRYGDKVKINFSSNVYSQADYTELKEHLMQHFDVVGHYPEPDAHTLECMLAKKLGVKKNSVMVTSGANEAIYLIAQLYKGWSSIIPQPTFSEYEDACHMFNHVISYDVKDEYDVLPQDRIPSSAALAMALMASAGGSRSGSPRPRLMESGLARSNIFLIPDIGTDCSLSDTFMPLFIRAYVRLDLYGYCLALVRFITECAYTHTWNVPPCSSGSSSSSQDWSLR